MVRKTRNSRAFRPDAGQGGFQGGLESLEERALLSTTAVVPVDIGNTFRNASVIPAEVVAGSENLNGRIDAKGDLDVFQFRARTDGIISVQVIAADPESPRLAFAAFNGTRNLIAAAGRDGQPSDLLLKVHAGDRTFLRIEAADPSAVGNYQIQFTRIDPSVDDAGDRFNQATPVDFGENLVVTNRIDALGDVDYFRFVAPFSGRVSLRMETSFGPDTAAMQINMLDGARHQVAMDTDVKSIPIDPLYYQQDRTLSLRVVKGRTYTMRVTSLQTANVDYMISMARQSIQEQVTEIPSETVRLGRIVGSIDQEFGTDLFRFTAPRSGRLVINMNATDGTLDPILTAYALPQKLLASNDDAYNLNSLISFRVTRGKSYYLRAEGYSNSTGPYELLFQLLSCAADDLTINRLSGEWLPFAVAQGLPQGTFNIPLVEMLKVPFPGFWKCPEGEPAKWRTRTVRGRDR